MCQRFPGEAERRRLLPPSLLAHSCVQPRSHPLIFAFAPLKAALIALFGERVTAPPCVCNGPGPASDVSAAPPPRPSAVGGAKQQAQCQRSFVSRDQAGCHFRPNSGMTGEWRGSHVTGMSRVRRAWVGREAGGGLANGSSSPE